MAAKLKRETKANRSKLQKKPGFQPDFKEGKGDKATRAGGKLMHTKGDKGKKGKGKASGQFQGGWVKSQASSQTVACEGKGFRHESFPIPGNLPEACSDSDTDKEVQAEVQRALRRTCSDDSSDTLAYNEKGDVLQDDRPEPARHSSSPYGSSTDSED